MKIPRGYSHPVKIGAGAYSTVLRVREVKLDRPVALKVITTRGRTAKQSVENEARLLASMSCSCVPRIYDIRRGAASITIVMEWIDGVPLSKFVATTLPSEVRRSVAADLVKAVEQLHGQGIVHRDIKPENIMLVSGRGIVFVDFGFSVGGRMATGRDAVPSLRGTPRYMAPELWAGIDKIDYVKSDLYSMGVVLQELCAPGVPPCVDVLLQNDPALRPASCAVFARRWEADGGSVDEEAAGRAVAASAAGHISQLLYEGACGLYGVGRRTEAYALLTESLDRWPDNSAAVALLNDRFSLPMSTSTVRPVLFFVAATLLLLLALAGAYVSGKRSRTTPTAGMAVFPAEPAERRLMLPLLPVGGGYPPDQNVDFRDHPGIVGPRGKIAVVLPDNSGTLFIDSRPVQAAPGNRFSVHLTAGTHRLDWYDSITRRTVGETVDLLPFATRTVSLVRSTDVR